MADGTVRCIDSEIPFEIPDSWQWCRIKHICSMQAGKNIQASKIFEEPAESHPYRCVGGNGLRGYVEEYNTRGHYAIVGRQGALCGCLNIEDGNFYATEHAVVVDSYGIISPIFLYHFLTALNLNQYATATAQPGLAVSNIIEVFFPLPPLKEQSRIVRTIESAIPFINQYDITEQKLRALNTSLSHNLKISILQEAIQGRLVPQIESEGTAEDLLTEIRVEKQRLVKEGKLKKSVLANQSRIFRGEDSRYYEQIGGKLSEIDVPFDIPSSWQWVRLPYIGTSELGKTMDKDKDGGDMTPYLCSINVYWEGINLDKVKRAPFSATERDKYLLHYGDLLICEGGDVGRCAVWEHTENMWFQNALHRVKLFGGISAYYVKLVIEFYKFNGTIDRLCRGVTIKHFTQTILYSLLFPLPPIDEQNRIVARIKSLSQLLK